MPKRPSLFKRSNFWGLHFPIGVFGYSSAIYFTLPPQKMPYDIPFKKIFWFCSKLDYKLLGTYISLAKKIFNLPASLVEPKAAAQLENESSFRVNHWLNPPLLLADWWHEFNYYLLGQKHGIFRAPFLSWRDLSPYVLAAKCAENFLRNKSCYFFNVMTSHFSVKCSYCCISLDICSKQLVSRRRRR